jgi:hypothetical protein
MSKHKQPARAEAQPARPAGGMALAASWPIYDVMLSKGWEQEAALITILIARRSPKSGKVAAGMLLVDLGCLGVKSAQVKLFPNEREYAAGLRAHALHVQPMAPADFNLVAKIVRTGLEYAGNLGFRPDPLFAQAEPLLAGADPDAVDTPVPTGGPEGKPFFVAGPNDDARRIINHLVRTVGADNFHYIAGVGSEDLGLEEEIERSMGEAPRRIEG